MNVYLKKFLQRGLAFGGFGPIVAGTVYLILSYTLEGFSLSGTEVFVAIISTYLLTFVHAGSSIFNQIEEWPIAKSMLCHLGSLYVSYTVCYLINSWIPYDWKVFLIYTLIFVAVYFVIWLTTFGIAKATSKKFNAKLK